MNVLEIAGLSALFISRNFLETNGFPASGASCLRTIAFSYPGGSSYVPLPFAIVADVRADVVERVQLRVCLTSLFAYVVDFSFV